MTELYRTTRAILMKDIRTEMRSREFLGNSFIFALLVIVIFNFAFTITPHNSQELASGILWIAFLFSGTLALGRSFQLEADNGCIQGLVLTPVDRMSIFWAKFAGNLLFLALIQAMIIPIFIILYNINVMEHFAQMVAVLLLADIGFMTLGTVLSAVSVNLLARDLLLPVLLFPLLVPLIIFAAGATSALIDTGDMAVFYSRVRLITAFDAVYFVVSSFLFEHILDES